MKSTIVWDIMPYSPLKINRRFGGTSRLHLQGRRISRARNQRESRWKALNVEAIRYAETLVDIKRTTPRYIPEDGTFIKTCIWVALVATRFHVGFLLGLFFDPEDGGDMFF
jgi:hypothetical protein